MQMIETEKTLKDYLWILLKYRWVMVTFSIVVIGLNGLITYTTVPEFTAVTRIVIEKENPNIVDFQEIYSIDATSKEFYQTQYKILESQALAISVIDALKLWDNEELNPSAGEEGQQADEPLTEAELQKKQRMLRERTIKNFQKRLQIIPVKSTRIVEIRYVSASPVIASNAANALVDAYMRYAVQEKLSATVGALGFLNEKIDEQRKKLEESELLLQKYREKYDIISLTEEREMIVKKLDQLNVNLLKARDLRIDAESRYRHAYTLDPASDEASSIPEVMDNNFIFRLKSDVATLDKEYSELMKKYGPKHPHVIAMNEKLRGAQEKITHEVKKIIDSLKGEYEVSLAREEALKVQIRELKDESQNLGKHSVTYGVLFRDVETNQELYNVLLTRLKEANISGGIQSTNVRVLDKAVPPTIPSLPDKKMNFILALMIAFFGSIGMAFFFDQLDNTVKTPEDIEKLIRVPYLGAVPQYRTSENKIPEPSESLVAFDDPKASTAEAFRGLRTSILFSSSEEKKTLLVTSSNPSEGKSMTCSNLAVTMAQNGSRTLLIDVDFRRPKVHKIFGISSETGFSNLLVGAAELDDIIIQTRIANLDVIPCGHIPPNPAELLSSESMQHYLDILKERYDRILFDSPPVLSATDPVILSTILDEVLLVIMAGKTSREAAILATKKLIQVKANLIGAVLNNIKSGREGYYYNQYYYYYYGESKKKKSLKERITAKFS